MNDKNINYCNRKDCQFYDKNKNDCSSDKYKCNSIMDYSKCKNYLINEKLINY